MTTFSATDTRRRLSILAGSLRSKDCTLKKMFADDPDRAGRFSITVPRLCFDYSKNLIDAPILDDLLALAERCELPQRIAALFDGATVNPTEGRPALHVALRGHRVNGLEQKVEEVLGRLDGFVSALQSGSWLGYSGKPIRHVVNLGIGGSHLGPAMVMRALLPFADSRLQVHFLSNVDPSGARELFGQLQAENTLFIVASKSFTTLETHQNATLARNWMLGSGAAEGQLGRHFAAVSSNIQAAAEFGIDRQNIFPMWDWVGGRYSLWSAIGVSIALGVGMGHFRELLAGAHAADEHFRTSEMARNIPVIMGLLDVWYGGFLDAHSHAVLPYSQHLELFPSFLQQLSMESLGKSVDLEGRKLDQHSGLVVWGAPGTDGQHSFHQLLHQGTRLIPADFIAFANPVYPDDIAGHNHLLANCFSQSQALMDGKTPEQATAELMVAGMDGATAAHLAPHKAIPGNRPSNTLLFDRLDPFTLGMLTALYEHSVYVQSALWNINAFDQWGVELGKKLSGPLYLALQSEEPAPGFDSSTNQLLGSVHRMRRL